MIRHTSIPFSYKPVAQPLGTVTQADGSKTDLHFRDLTNTIIHAKEFQWALSDADNPKIICHSSANDKWQTAQIDVAALMTLIGNLGY